MNSRIKRGKSEFDKGNYKKALNLFNSVGKNDKDYECAQLYKTFCLVELKEYGDALKIINRLLEKTPYSEILWFNKATCHIFLNEDDEAFKVLNKIEAIIDSNDKTKLVYVAKLYNLLNDFEDALKYCDMALAIDGTYRDALHEKSLVAIALDDNRMIDEVADKLLETTSDELLSILPVFLLKIFSRNYQKAITLVEDCNDGNISDDTMELFKSVVYKRICEDLNINILLDDEHDFSVDEALNVLFDYINHGKDHGNLGDVNYFIV